MMSMNILAKSIGGCLLGVFLFSSCGNDPNSPGKEYAPNMYDPVGYEPYKQVEKNPLNPQGSNLWLPVEGTVSRRNYKTSFGEGDSLSKDLMIYNIPADSIEISARLLTNPVPKTDQVVAEGQVLFQRYCQHCHGAGGEGDGKVGAVYKGVPNFTSDAMKNLPEGHIFHVITFGKARMWPHGSQINPEERWKIVRYVQKLQKGS
jgi:mono/diheme cytochrome c family protein